MSLGQNVVFGISGNFAKLVFPKISPAVLDIRDELVFYFRTPNFLQNFAKIHKKSSNFAPKHQNFPKKNIKILPTSLKGNAAPSAKPRRSRPLENGGSCRPPKSARSRNTPHREFVGRARRSITGSRRGPRGRGAPAGRGPLFPGKTNRRRFGTWGPANCV